jgi:hypothetical protein
MNLEAERSFQGRAAVCASLVKYGWANLFFIGSNTQQINYAFNTVSLFC